jgi:ELWxxDGT repeat protein
VNGELFFTANDGAFGVELWRSDGTEAGTTRVRDINLGALNSTPAALFAIDDELLFVADDGVHGRELWRSDGTDPGTVMVKDINPGLGDSFPTSLAEVNSVLFFCGLQRRCPRP